MRRDPSRDVGIGLVIAVGAAIRPPKKRSERLRRSDKRRFRRPAACACLAKVRVGDAAAGTAIPPGIGGTAAPPFQPEIADPTRL